MNENTDTTAKQPFGAGRPAYAPALGLLLVCLVVGLVYALLAQDPLEDDSIHHFLMSRLLDRHGHLLVSVWGRPAVTLAYFPAAQLGFFWCRLTSLAICLAACWYTYLLARDFGLKYAWLAVPFVFFQYQFFRLSGDLLTEPLFALLLICGIRNFILGRYPWAALQFSAGAAARPEGFFFIAFFGVLFLAGAIGGRRCRRKADVLRFIVTGALLVSVPVVWSIVGGIIHSGGGSPDPLWLTKANAWDTELSKYGADGPLHYLIMMPYITGTVVLTLAILGFGVCLKSGRLRAVPAFWVFFLVLHTVLRTSGLYASGGYSRYFVAVAPLAGLMAVAGIGRFARSFHWLIFTFFACVGFYLGAVPLLVRIPFFKETWVDSLITGPGRAIGLHEYSLILLCGIAALLAVWVLLWKRRRLGSTPYGRASVPVVLVVCLVLSVAECAAVIRPASADPTYVLIGEFGEWLEEKRPALFEDLGSSGPRKLKAKLTLARFYLHMKEGWDPYDDTRFGTSSIQGVESLPTGSIFVWDSDFGPGENGMSAEELDGNIRLRFLREFSTKRRPGWKDFHLRVYEVIGEPQGEGG